MPALVITNSVRNEEGKVWTTGARTYQTATRAEISKKLILPDALEVAETTVMSAANILWVANLSTTIDNALHVGLATGVYFMEIPPTFGFAIPLEGKPANPTLYFKFVNAAGGTLEYGLWD